MVICKSDRMSDKNVGGSVAVLRAPSKDSSAQWSCGHWDFDPRGPRRDGEGAGARVESQHVCGFICLRISGWWFGTCFIFPSSWDDDPNLTNIFQGG